MCRARRPAKAVNTTDPIFNEIRQTCDDLAQQSGYDLQRLFEYARQRERDAVAKGTKFVSFAGADAATGSCVLREEPPTRQT